MGTGVNPSVAVASKSLLRGKGTTTESLLLAKRSDVLSAVLRIIMRVVVGRYVSQARELGIDNPKAGGINVLQRFGGALNFDFHSHLAAIDSVYSFDARTGAPQEEVSELVRRRPRLRNGSGPQLVR